MATLFAPEVSDIGPSAMTRGLDGPSNIDYSGLFQALNTLAEPKKVSETEVKANAIKRLTYDLSKIDAMENKTEKEAAYRMSRRTARADYGLDEKDVSDIYSQFTGELPFAEKTIAEIQTDNIMKAYAEDEEMSMSLATNWAKSGGDPDKFMAESMATYHNTIGRRAQLEADKREIDFKNMTEAQADKAFKQTLISSLQNENNRLAAEYIRMSPEILKQEGLDGLKGPELYSRLSSNVAQLEQRARISARSVAAQNGKVLTKEEEDSAVASFTDTTATFTSMSEETKNALTAKSASELAMFNSSLSPEVKFVSNTPQFQDFYFQHVLGGPAGIVKNMAESNMRFKTLLEKEAGAFDPNSLNTNNAGGVDKSVEGPSDSLSTIQARYKNVFSPEGLASASKYDDPTKLSVITDIRDSIQNPSAIDLYSKTTLNTVSKNFMFGYALGIPELDVKGSFIQPRAIEIMFGSKALAYAEVLTKKMPVEASDIWNKINVMSDVTADRVLINLKQNINTLNEDAFGTPYQNPFAFSIDETGTISGSFVPSAVSKNPYIKKALNNYDVVNLSNVDKATFFKVMKDYAALSDRSNYTAIEESIKSLEILARVSNKVPEGSRRENAYSTISLGLSELVSGSMKSIEEMTPAEFNATRPFETTRSRLVKGQ
jgi:hypothetical protein